MNKVELRVNLSISQRCKVVVTMSRCNPTLFLSIASLLYAFVSVSSFSTILRRNVWTGKHFHQLYSSAKKDNLSFAESALNITGVTLKMAFDTSFAVADASELKSERFTCSESLDMVHKLRRWSHAVLVGRSTVERDDCTLTVRRVPLLPNCNSQPVRVIIDPSLKLIEDELEYAVMKDKHEVFVYHSMGNISPKQVFDNVKFINIKKSGDVIPIVDILIDLKNRNIHHVMVEGGPATARQFLLQKVVDRAIFVRAPVSFIEPVSSGMDNEMFQEAGLKMIKAESCGDDMIEYWSRTGVSWPSADGFENQTWPY